MYVYRFLNKKGEIIYIGKTKELMKRIKSHNHLSKLCYNNVDKIEYITLNNQDEMSIYERYLINKYNPKYNREYKNNSTFEFELPEKEWKEYLYSFKNITKDIKHIDIGDCFLICEDDIDIEAYFLFIDEYDFTKYEYELLKILVVSCSHGGITIEDDGDYLKADMKDFITELYNIGFITITTVVNKKLSELVGEKVESVMIHFNEGTMFGKNIGGYRYFKTLNREKRDAVYKKVL